MERLASELIELSTLNNLAFWLPGANVLRGWTHSVSGDTSEGISWVEWGVEDYRASGSMVGMPLWLAVKAEALCLADRSSDALEVIGEAEAIAFGGRPSLALNTPLPILQYSDVAMTRILYS